MLLDVGDVIPFELAPSATTEATPDLALQLVAQPDEGSVIRPKSFAIGLAFAILEIGVKLLLQSRKNVSSMRCMLYVHDEAILTMWGLDRITANRKGFLSLWNAHHRLLRISMMLRL